MKRLFYTVFIASVAALGFASGPHAQESFVKKVIAQAAKAFPDAVFLRETNEKVVALTIDDVPAHDDPGDDASRLVLNVIAEHNHMIADPNMRVHATFFIISSHLRDDTTIIDEIEAQGHEIANHGVADETAVFANPEDFENGLRASDARIAQFTDSPIRWFRPGRGLYNQQMVAALRKMEGYEPRLALASMLPVDVSWPTNDPNFTNWYVGQQIFSGAILVVHVHSPEVAKQTAAALALLLDHLKSEGYRVVTLSDLWDNY